jgi:hypothetical protein
MKYLKTYEANYKSNNPITYEYKLLGKVEKNDHRGFQNMSGKTYEFKKSQNLNDLFEVYETITNNKEAYISIDEWYLDITKIVKTTETLSEDKMKEMPEYKKFIMKKDAKKYNL